MVPASATSKKIINSTANPSSSKQIGLMMRAKTPQPNVVQPQQRVSLSISDAERHSSNALSVRKIQPGLTIEETGENAES